jgi:hypothetical protein
MSTVPPVPPSENDPDRVPPVPPADAPEQPSAPYTPPAEPYAAPPAEPSTGGAIPGTLPGSTQPAQPTQPYGQPNQPYAQPAQPYGQPNQPYGQTAQPYAQQPYGTGAPVAKSPVLSIISMISGIVGLLGFWVVFIPFVGGILQLFFPAAAVVLGFLGKQKEPQAKGFWLTGLITGFVGLAIGLLSIILWAIAFAAIESQNFNNPNF